MNLSMGTLLSGLLLGAVGFVMFLHGKREGDPATLLGGLALGFIPMFVHVIWAVWAISGAVLAGVLLLKRSGGGRAV